MIYKTILTSAVVALGLSGAALAAANTSDGGDTRAFANVAVSAADAVAAVEANSGGKVVELMLRDENGKPAYQVSVMQADGSKLTFLVDALSGAVAASSDVQAGGEAAAQSDMTESGESANDADSANEDAD